jgi:homoserine/homoserine lactone efflux protein
MNLSTWLSFVSASLVFGLIPGPSVCFTIAHALKHGARRTFPSILGQLLANCTQIIVVLFGMSRVLEHSVILFQVIKMGGAVYLIYLGLKQWSAHIPNFKTEDEQSLTSDSQALWDGLIVCGTNPKAIFYYAALLPQFIIPTSDETVQLIILAITSIIIAAVVLSIYTLFADRVRIWFKHRKYWKIQNRLSGVLMIVAGIALSMVSRK